MRMQTISHSHITCLCEIGHATRFAFLCACVSMCVCAWTVSGNANRFAFPCIIVKWNASRNANRFAFPHTVHITTCIAMRTGSASLTLYTSHHAWECEPVRIPLHYSEVECIKECEPVRIPLHYSEVDCIKECEPVRIPSHCTYHYMRGNANWFAFPDNVHITACNGMRTGSHSLAL